MRARQAWLTVPAVEAVPARTIASLPSTLPPAVVFDERPARLAAEPTAPVRAVPNAVWLPETSGVALPTLIDTVPVAGLPTAAVRRVALVAVASTVTVCGP